MPITPNAINRTPIMRGKVPESERNSACAAVGPLHFVSSSLWQRMCSSELSSLTELRSGLFAGNAKNRAPLVFASRTKAIECSTASGEVSPGEVHSGCAELGWQVSFDREAEARLKAPLRNCPSSKAGALHQCTLPNSR